MPRGASSYRRVISSDGMPPRNPGVALLIIDVINDLEFPERDQLLRFAMPMARKLARLKRRVAQQGVPVIYVNDNFGRWQSDLHHLIERCSRPGAPGRALVETLRPEEQDYFVLKPKHSGFYGTTLDLLLNYLEIHTLIITGIAGNNCVLFTANDAYMRDYRLIVPSDCVASNTKRENDYALAQMRTILKADVRPSGRVVLRDR